jgi:hypothetical protein
MIPLFDSPARLVSFAVAHDWANSISFNHIFHAGGMLNQAARAGQRDAGPSSIKFPLHQKRHRDRRFQARYPFQGLTREERAPQPKVNIFKRKGASVRLSRGPRNGVLIVGTHVATMTRQGGIGYEKSFDSIYESGLDGGGGLPGGCLPASCQRASCEVRSHCLQQPL